MATLKDTKAQPFRVGVLIHAPVQLLDLSPIDLFGMLTKDYLQACRLPAPLVGLGIPLEIHYISSLPGPPPSPSPSPHLAEITASAALRLTTTIDDKTVAPGTLDVILIPGPDPSLAIPDGIGDWLRSHYEQGGATLMSVCTGIFVSAASGVLEGKEATGPRGILGELKGKYGGVKWVEKRWCRATGGRVWSSGGITNGQDMVAAYLREKYPGPLSDTVCMLADVGDRGQEYRTGKVVSNGLWIWAILRAWLGRK